MLLQRSELASNEIRLHDRVVSLAQENDIQPLIKVVESILRQLSNRDAVGFDEKHVKAIFTSLFYTTQIYTIHSEYETEREYVDLLLTRRPPIEPNYQFAFELKYLKRSEASQLKTKKQEARTQLRRYLQHDDLQSLSDLRAWIIVFVGPEAKAVEEIR
ncbi:PD-(D/E)XK nuclease domain-containing protein [Chloroflexi bacterium TSY]|nr:PD-(D/E)XK nuclease domain-containing protein [Chloroflexi bacterium TSY]